MPTSPADPPPWAAGATDEQLVLLVRQGPTPTAAAWALYVRYVGMIRRFVFWRVSHGLLPAAEAEDALQEAALALLETASRFDPARAHAAPFRAFYRRVLGGRLNNLLRARARRERLLDRSEGAAEALDEARGGRA